ncbi:MAG: Ldh family oxidoreductase [Betaproteobacteria bacterium]|nr:Ldh family oxidoreductase [Betaproteobacteria bacterium]
MTIDQARALAQDAVERLGYAAADAAVVADHLVDAELCGYDYSGLAKILNVAENPRCRKPRRPITITKETPVSALIDGGNHVGMLSVYRATEIAVAKARQSGIAVVGVHDTFNSGRGAYYVERVAQADLVGIHFVSASMRVAPPGGAQSALGTNPIAFGVPSSRGPLIFDMGTAAIMGSDLMLKERLNQLLPEGVAVGPDGHPTRDPQLAHKGGLLTFGGYKGFGLSLIIQALGLLAGAASETEKYYGFVILALDPGLLVPLDQFKREVSRLVERVKATPRAPGVQEIRIPSERSFREREQRLRAGVITIDREVYEALTALQPIRCA